LYVGRDEKIVGVGSTSGGITVAAHRPGHLAVMDRSVVLGVFSQGNWAIVGGGVTDCSQILQKALPQDSFPERFLVSNIVMRLAMAAREYGRGATFVLLPTDSQWDGIDSISYPVEAFSAWPQAFDAWSQARRTTPWKLDAEQYQGLARTAQAVTAAGAGIDGATLIDNSQLRVLGFGAKINAKEDGSDVALHDLPNRTAQIVSKKALGGMRHQTAARLVAQNHNATAITVSQDGPVSLFVWHDKDSRVMVIKNLDRYLSAEAAQSQ
jgi:hypothetical protein